MKKVMLIGYGAMAQAVIERLPPQVRVEWIVARNRITQRSACSLVKR